MLTNLLPWLAVKGLSEAIKVREDFIGSKKLALGSFLFPILYLIETVVFWLYTNGYGALLFALTLYPSGLFAYRYGQLFKMLKQDLHFNRLLKQQPGEIEELVAEREALCKLCL